MSIADAFLEQNYYAAVELTTEDVEGWAEHHSGGLIVLGARMPNGLYCKMHDSWGPDEEEIVVHVYDTEAYDPDDDDTEVVESFQSGRAAFTRFLELIGEAP